MFSVAMPVKGFRLLLTFSYLRGLFGFKASSQEKGRYIMPTSGQAPAKRTKKQKDEDQLVVLDEVIKLVKKSIDDYHADPTLQGVVLPVLEQADFEFKTTVTTTDGFVLDR